VISVLVRKTFANAQRLYYWQEENFGESEDELSFVKQKLGFWFFKNYLTLTSKG